MSIFSSIDAERDLKIVEKAIADIKAHMTSHWQAVYSREELVQILDKVLKYCRENITE